MSATRQLAAFASQLEVSSISDAARQMTSRAFLDFVACTVAGAATDAAEKVRRGFSETCGSCDILGTGYKRAAHAAAFLNAHACHVLEYDDLHGPSIYHPGAPTIAAALATAERTGAGAADINAAIVAGYEVGIRLGEAAGKDHYRNFHTTGTVGTIGAAVAAARVLKLDADAMADAIGNAVTHAAGLWAFRDDQADSKPLHAAHAAMMGVVCADLASAGVRGARCGLESKHGFLATLGGDRNSSSLVAGLGTESERITALTIKAYPCCGHTHSGIEAAKAVRAAMAEANLAVDTIESVIVSTYGSAIAVAGVTAPTSVAQAAFSYPHIVAWVLVNGDMRGAFVAGALEEEAVLNLRKCVVLQRSAKFDAAYPRIQPVTIDVHMQDGRAVARTCDVALGSPSMPMSNQAHHSKTAELLGADRDYWLAYAQRTIGLQRHPEAAS